MNKDKDNSGNNIPKYDSPEVISAKNASEEKTSTNQTGLSRRKLLQVAVTASAIATLSSAIPGVGQAEGKKAKKKTGNEGEHRVYTLKGFEHIESHFQRSLAEAGEGDTFEGLICIYKKNNGAIGIAYHVSSGAETVARTPEGGPSQPEWFHYRPQGETTGAFGRIMAEDSAPKEIVLPEVGPGITYKLVALASSWCFGPYYCK